MHLLTYLQPEHGLAIDLNESPSRLFTEYPTKLVRYHEGPWSVVV